MGQFIQRDPETNDDLVAFWEGDAPSEGDQVSVEMGDRLLIFNDEGLLTALDAGRHLLSAAAQPALAPVLSGDDDDGVYLAFVSQKRYPLQTAGELAEEELETGYSLRATVQVKDAAKMVELIAMVDETEQSVEDWLADEIAIDAAGAAGEAGVDLEDVSDQLEKVRTAAISAANEALADHGIELLSLDELEFGEFDDGDD